MRLVLFVFICLVVTCNSVEKPLPTSLPSIVNFEEIEFNRLYSLSKKNNLPMHIMVKYFLIQESGNANIAEAIIKYSLQYKVPLLLSFALCHQESRFNPKAINRSNSNKSIDYGLFQLNNRSFPNNSKKELLDIDFNIEQGIAYLSYLLNRFNDRDLALGSYNAGPSKINSKRIPWSTFRYISGINSKVAEYRISLKFILKN